MHSDECMYTQVLYLDGWGWESWGGGRGKGRMWGRRQELEMGVKEL